MSGQNVTGILIKTDTFMARTAQTLCVSLLALIVITITASVFTRWVIFYPLNFADALAKYLLMWMAFLGMGLAIRSGDHIAMDMLMNKFQGRARTLVVLLINVLVSAFLLVIAYYGFQNANNGRDMHDPFVFGVSMMVPYLSVPVGAVYALIQINVTTAIHLLDDGKNEGGGDAR